MQLSIFTAFPKGKDLGRTWSAPATFCCMVGSSGLEPPTSRLSGVCSNQLSYEPVHGGGKRVRTADPLLAGQVLYQLSYTPVYVLRFSENTFVITKQMLRFERSKLCIKNE